ncbi:uncharacterized protein LOC115878145 isoform X2 [Sitophilus oryzae]|uniref:Uncharacterized protein LOC115878145 isoform X2 n=1 Tax=Sitophilus oryzae TaxID=7048 RepID=A0A6J2XG87_SITOR|nr:uncharacterized protein LOC115878145 isoform X2 [Sitophilus oryzae]
MRAKTAILITVLINGVLSLPLLTEIQRATNLTSPLQTVKSHSLISHPQTDLSSAKDLTTQQTENIRQIIAAEKRSYEQRAKETTATSNNAKKHDTSLVDIGEDRYMTLEEFRSKCQHFSRLFGPPQNDNKPTDRSDRYSSTVSTPVKSEYIDKSVVEVTKRPVYIRNKPTFIQKTNGGFYVTTSSKDDFSSTKRPYWVSSTHAPVSSTVYVSSTGPPPLFTTSTTPTPTVHIEGEPIIAEKDGLPATPPINIRYTKFEPVILQKTILSDGRVLYHWHKSLPTSAISLPAPIAQIVPPYQIAPAIVAPGSVVMQEQSTTTEQATTTTEKSSWLFVPFSSFFGGSHHEEETTVESSSSTPPTSTSTPDLPSSTKNTPKPIPNSLNAQDVKLQQLKFVIPVHYDDIDSTISSQNKPIDYDRFAYYPKALRPNNPALGQPSLPLIKGLGVPQRYNLAYTGAGYGLNLNNGLYHRYANGYGQEYPGLPLGKEIRSLDDVSIQE